MRKLPQKHIHQGLGTHPAPATGGPVCLGAVWPYGRVVDFVLQATCQHRIMSTAVNGNKTDGPELIASCYGRAPPQSNPSDVFLFDVKCTGNPAPHPANRCKLWQET